MSVLSQSLLTLVSRHLVSLMLLSVWHNFVVLWVNNYVVSNVLVCGLSSIDNTYLRYSLVFNIPFTTIQFANLQIICESVKFTGFFFEKSPSSIMISAIFCNFVMNMNAIFAKTLEDWYVQNKRDLPWRQTKDPYLIWISEIILQQTRVAQGIDYYYRFIASFPDISSLASAEEDHVLRLWQGLGYYSRARNLHKAAKQIVEKGGLFPNTFKEIRSLAGIGDYTAAAIMSFAFDKPYAVLDGNVYRVLSRIHGIDIPIDSNNGKKLFSKLSQELLDVNRPALYNQAIMDFGALQCLPKGFDCSTCPFQMMCVARFKNIVADLPVKSHKVTIRRRYFHYFYIHDLEETQMLIRRRSDGDIWQGLYDLPLIESDINNTLDFDNTWVHSLLNFGAELVCHRQGVKHQLTHQLIICDFYELILPSYKDIKSLIRDIPELYECMEIPILEKENYGMPKLVLQLLDMSD